MTEELSMSLLAKRVGTFLVPRQRVSLEQPKLYRKKQLSKTKMRAVKNLPRGAANDRSGLNSAA